MLGEGIRTNDQTLCANVSFWRKLSCIDGSMRCQVGNSGQCVGGRYWGFEGSEYPCSDGSDMYRPIKQPTETEKPLHQATQADSNEHGSDDGEQWINSDGDDNFAEGEEKPVKMGGADKRDSAGAQGSQHSQTEQMWKTQPVTDQQYNRYYKGAEEGAKYVKDHTTGLWMIPVSKESCKASQGFVCKVRLCNFEMNHDDDVYNFKNVKIFGNKVLISAEKRANWAKSCQNLSNCCLELICQYKV